MHTRILKKSDEDRWDKFVEKHPLGNIQQTSAWGSFQNKVSARGKRWIIAIKEKDKIIGGSLVIRYKMPKGKSWLYSARGPLLDYTSPDLQKQIDLIVKELKPIAKEENSIFYRIDPDLQARDSHPHPRIKGFTSSKNGFYPEHTLMVDLTAGEDEILAQMKQKGRYNIKKAKKARVKIVKADPTDLKKFQIQIDKFQEILEETTSRDGFSGHNKAYYKNMVETLSEQNLCDLFLAEYEGQVISGVIITYFKDIATYYYGASSNKYRKVMAPYLLQWHAIQESKKRDHKKYDFLGIAATDSKEDPWQGITQFKTRFGGERVIYQKPQEHSFRPLMHLLYKFYKFIRKLKK